MKQCTPILNFFLFFCVFVPFAIQAQTARPIPNSAISNVIKPQKELAQKTKQVKLNSSKNFQKNKVISNGYYSWKATGNPDIDAANAEAAAQILKKKNPTLYEKIIRDSTRVINISLEDFNVMSKTKQQHILNNPNLYNIDKRIKQ